MTVGEQQLLTAAARGETPAVLLATGTPVDVGLWFRQRRAWIACFTGRVAVFAAGKQPQSVEIPVAELTKSFYNFLTGELVLAPAPAVRIRRLKLTPVDGSRILEQINQKEVSHA